MFLSVLIKNSFLPDNLFIEFNKGLNVLIGKNGAGKSTVIEMLNYSLFGTVALRSPISEYKPTFEVVAEIFINNTTYKIERKVKSSKIYKLNDDKKTYEVLATGITATNTFIKDLLSYDYKVYSLTNYCEQNGLLKLSNCTPQQLVDLIESISGLTDSYRLMHQLKELKKEAKIQTRTLKTSSTINIEDLIFEENIEFEKFLNNDLELIGNSKEVTINLFKELTELNKLQATIISFEEELTNLNESVKLSVEYKYKEEYEEKLEIVKQLEQELEKTNFQLSTFKSFSEEYTKEFLDIQSLAIENYKAYLDYLNIKKQIEEHTTVCPNCNHSFTDTNFEYNTIYDSYTPEPPIITPKQLREGYEYLDQKDLISSLRSTQKQLEDQLSDLPSRQFLENYLHDLNFNISLNEKFSKKIEEFTSLKDSTIFKDCSLTSFNEEVDKKIISVEKEYHEFLELNEKITDYIHDKKSYLDKKEYFETYNALVEKSEYNELMYGLLYQVFLETKKEIQTNILPVLNSLASKTLSEVTGGERNRLEITDEWQIKVDTNNINVIEGSAQVIANLSLRLALLNTFYKDNFLVGLFDEIDASLHSDRFNYMEENFNRLALSGYQLIVISHKTYTTGNIIDLKDVII